MLVFNPKNILLMRGIERVTAFLVRLGMDYSTASRFMKSKSQFVKIKDIEKLCVALNCTPNELFEWQTDADTTLPENHSLNALNRSYEVKQLQQIVKDIPVDKLAQVEILLNTLKNDNG